MVLSITDPEVERLARAVAQRTRETITQALITALRERLEREEQRGHDIDVLVEEVMSIGKHCATLPLRDMRPDGELLGYAEQGLPHRTFASRLLIFRAE